MWLDHSVLYCFSNVVSKDINPPSLIAPHVTPFFQAISYPLPREMSPRLSPEDPLRQKRSVSLVLGIYSSTSSLNELTNCQTILTCVLQLPMRVVIINALDLTKNEDICPLGRKGQEAKSQLND